MNLKSILTSLLGDGVNCSSTPQGEIQLQVDHLLYFPVAQSLLRNNIVPFEQLIDLTVVDLLFYGKSDWKTQKATMQGFSRAVLEKDFQHAQQPQRFELVTHFLSYKTNSRVRLKSFIPTTLEMMSLSELWPNADWHEREAFDLFGVIFKNHKDLRRILTDYGFVGFPFRKDFPVIGEVELRYDYEQKRCIYEPTSIEDRTLTPKVIRQS
ncbi:NADH-quinone oxidoreductase subunit C [bacterium]|jgi:NADH-quinone oxidoreductase subunit C|nr:NADH-quinone oxidoreductase subunit C [bacterium]NBW56201.1 NADH-quinone oxidoreductase subunit C [bacterium]NBX72232.1 NADH-quinone oxidoreductase subunit C [bacterium]